MNGAVLCCSPSFSSCAVSTSKETRTSWRRARIRPKCSTASRNCWHIRCSGPFSRNSTTLCLQTVHCPTQRTSDPDTRTRYFPRLLMLEFILGGTKKRHSARRRGSALTCNCARCQLIFTTCSELRNVLYLALSVTSVYEISRGEPLNGFAPNSQEGRVWSLTRTSLNVKVKGQVHHGQKLAFFGPFGSLRAACLVKHL